MEQRSFGDGVCVSVLGIGCGRVGSISNPVPMREIEGTLEAAVAAGVNLFGHGQHLRRAGRDRGDVARHRSPRGDRGPRNKGRAEMPSIWITSKSRPERSDAIQSFMRAADSATNRREAADFDRPATAGPGTSPSGNRTDRANLRVATLISIWFMDHFPSRSSATAASQLGTGCSSRQSREALAARFRPCRRGSRSCPSFSPSGAPAGHDLAHAVDHRCLRIAIHHLAMPTCRKPVRAVGLSVPSSGPRGQGAKSMTSCSLGNSNL